MTDVDITQVLEQELVHTAFQPIVTLPAGDVVAYEALARGPEGSPLETPVALFEAAREAGLTRELDTLCMRAAFRAAGRLGISTLFVNAEPSSFDGPGVLPETPMQVVVEVTERGVVDRPAELLDALQRAREAGWGVALDDVGVDWRSLAMLPVLGPQVVKLDRSLLTSAQTRSSSRILRAARAYVDRSAGALLAEGVEDGEHAQQAIGFGASLGQGFLLGRPQTEPRVGPHVPLELEPVSFRAERTVTPFGLLQREGIPTAVATKAQLLPISRDIELDSAEQPDPNLLLGTFQTVDRFTEDTRARYARLAEGLAFVAVFGHDIPPEPVPGVVGSALVSDEPLGEEWIVVSVGAHQTSGLIARDLGDEDVPDLDRRFEYALLSERTIIERAARSLMLRITASVPPGR